MNNYLISETIGDITGSAYEGRTHCVKDYNMVKSFCLRAYYRKMPDSLICQAMMMSSDWMMNISE